MNRLARENEATDGFEGNAQSFRIVVRLAPHRKDYPGLNLTRATLDAVLKYPWLRDLTNGDPDYQVKFGAYRSDQHDFDEARKLSPQGHQSVEAAIMDYADDIAYSVHDVDDFYRAGLIPLESLRPGHNELAQFFEERGGGTKVTRQDLKKYETEVERMLTLLPTSRRFTGEYSERARLRHAMSDLIDRFVKAVQLQERDSDGEVLLVDPAERVCMRVLQGMVWHYVICNPRLATQQHGQRQIIGSLFRIYLEAIQDKQRAVSSADFPRRV